MDEEFIKQQAKILIVDDEQATIDLLERLLQREGYVHIRGVRDPRQAPTVYKQFQPDLIILDLHMPHWNGFVLLEELRAELEREKYLPVLMLTGDPNPDVRHQALVLGVKDFLNKPPDLFEARYRIWNLLHTRFLYHELRARIGEEKAGETPPQSGPNEPAGS